MFFFFFFYGDTSGVSGSAYIKKEKLWRKRESSFSRNGARSHASGRVFFYSVPFF